MNDVFFSLGSNLGDRKKNLEKAVFLLRAGHSHFTQSAVYETAPWGMLDQPSFLNLVLRLPSETQRPGELLQQIHEIENVMGRTRTEKWGPRIIDIDILFYNSEVIVSPDLVIPHPGITGRRFVLAPMADIAPGFVHPQWGLTIQELLVLCQDPLEVKCLSD